jgi:hypothetical protein
MFALFASAAPNHLTADQPRSYDRMPSVVQTRSWFGYGPGSDPGSSDSMFCSGFNVLDPLRTLTE